MDAADELREYLRTHEPDFYRELLERPLPRDWRPDPAVAAEVLRTMTRNECRACGEATRATPVKCAVCGVARYCDVECQRLDADTHAAVCHFDRMLKAGMQEHAYSGHTQ
jgi:hypothetical protein